MNNIIDKNVYKTVPQPAAAGPKPKLLLYNNGDVVAQNPHALLPTDFNGDDHRRANVRFPIPAVHPQARGLDSATRTIYTNQYIDKVTYLTDFPRAEEAEALMRELTLKVRLVMNAYGWTVDHFTEFYPDQANLLGDNRSFGLRIRIRLRTPQDRNIFRSYNEILSTVVHELTHNFYKAHSGDFFDLWDTINTKWFGNHQERVKAGRLLNPQTFPCPEDHTQIFAFGVKIFVPTETAIKFFPGLLRGGRRQGRKYSTVVHRTWKPTAVLRLIQFARGLDPADDKPFDEIANINDYIDVETGEIYLSDEYRKCGTNAVRALKLYLDMWVPATTWGIHPSMRDWLLNGMKKAYVWDQEATLGLYTEPKVKTKIEMTTLLGELSMLIYGRTAFVAPDSKLPRQMVIWCLRSVLDKTSWAAGRFDIDLILKYIRQSEDMMLDLKVKPW